jgi:hypothetical protein
MFGLLVYRFSPQWGSHSPRTDRMMPKPPSTPSARSVKRKKKVPGLVMLKEGPAPLKWRTGMPTTAIPTMRVMT